MLLQNGSYIFIYYIGRPFFLKLFLNDFLKLFSKCLYRNPLNLLRTLSLNLHLSPYVQVWGNFDSNYDPID